MPRWAALATAWRLVSGDCWGLTEAATIAVEAPPSLRRTASSTPISSNGFIDILTLAVSTPVLSGLTRILTLKSITRLTATRTFMARLDQGRFGAARRGIVHVHKAKASISCNVSVMGVLRLSDWPR